MSVLGIKGEWELNIWDVSMCNSTFLFYRATSQMAEWKGISHSFNFYFPIHLQTNELLSTAWGTKSVITNKQNFLRHIMMVGIMDGQCDNIFTTLRTGTETETETSLLSPTAMTVILSSCDRSSFLFIPFNAWRYTIQQIFIHVSFFANFSLVHFF